jgi:hypothetical protein
MTKPSSAARRSFAVASTSGVAAEMARTALPRGNAVDAVVAGVLGACAEHPGVLLGALQLLVRGPAIGARAIDGRMRQPGRGTRRPRGFVDEAIPAAARVAVPGLPSALATAATAYGMTALAKVAAPALDLAKATSKPRAKVLGRVARMGAAALREPAFAEPWLDKCGVLAGGLLTEADLAEAEATIVEGELDVARVPWWDEVEAVTKAGGPAFGALAVADTRGMLAIACWDVAEVDAGGFALEALELVAPPRAVPVMRGETRVGPGTKLPSPAPIGIDGDLAYVAAAGQGPPAFGDEGAVRVARPR